MKNRDRIIRYYQGTDNGELAARLIDLADSTAKGRPYAVSEFVSPGAVQIGETIQAHVPSLVLKTFGGYEGAERVKLAFVSADYDGPVDFGITACRLSWDDRYRLLGHRDVLGSLMSLGVGRERFGDIIMQDAGAVLLADTKLVPYLQQNFTKIAMVSIAIEEMPLSDIAPRQEKVKEIKTTVASLASMPLHLRALAFPVPRRPKPSRATGSRSTGSLPRDRARTSVRAMSFRCAARAGWNWPRSRVRPGRAVSASC